MQEYCELLGQFAEDADKAKQADFDCIAENGPSHVMGAYCADDKSIVIADLQ